MELNIREMLIGNPVRLRYVFRFSTSRVQHPESVAEHCYFVAFYCLLIGRWCNEQGLIGPDGKPAVNLEKLLSRAVLHDLEEARSGDFPRPFKHSSPDLEQLLEKAGSIAYQQVMRKLVGPYADGMWDHWINSKDGSYEGRILEFADFLCVLSFMHEEVGAGGNRSIEGHVNEMGDYFQKFLTGSYKFIEPLVFQAGTLLAETFPNQVPETPADRPAPYSRGK